MIAAKEKKMKGFRLMSPEGEIFEGFGYLRFAKEHNLSISTVAVLVTGKIVESHGWKNPDFIKQGLLTIANILVFRNKILKSE